MTGKGDEPSTADGLQYPMVELFTGGMIAGSIRLLGRRDATVDALSFGGIGFAFD
jgi:hypothetical protein